MKIAIGCDPNAAEVKNRLIEHLRGEGYEIEDFGSDDAIYANTAIRVAEAVAAGQAERGILLCGTGIGMSIAANKVQGAYAALLSDVYSAERAVKSNNANIACLGAFTLGYKVIESLASIWLNAVYVDGTGSAKKIARYIEYDRSRQASGTVSQV